MGRRKLISKSSAPNTTHVIRMNPSSHPCTNLVSWLHDLVEEVRELRVVQHRLGEIRIRGRAHAAPSDVVLPSIRLDAIARRIRLLDLAQRIPRKLDSESQNVRT